MTFDQRQVIPDLICWQLNYAPWVWQWFRKRSQGAVMDAIQSSTLRELLLPVPKLDEQELVYQMYYVCQAKILVETERLEKLKMEKSGLMHDLLTGKVRVKVEEASKAAAHA